MSASVLTVLCDLDGIVVDLLSPWLGWYNDKFGETLTVSDIVSWEIHEHAKYGHEIYGFLQEPNLFAGLSPLPGAIEALHELREQHRVVIVTACAKNPQTSADKLAWVARHLGWGRKDIIICHQKELVRGDILIDDSPGNLERYKKAWPNAHTVTFDYPYNRDVDVSFRANRWNEIVKWILGGSPWKPLTDGFGRDPYVARSTKLNAAMRERIAERVGQLVRERDILRAELEHVRSELEQEIADLRADCLQADDDAEAEFRRAKALEAELAEAKSEIERLTLRCSQCGELIRNHCCTICETCWENDAGWN